MEARPSRRAGRNGRGCAARPRPRRLLVAYSRVDDSRGGASQWARRFRAVGPDGGRARDPRGARDPCEGRAETGAVAPRRRAREAFRTHPSWRRPARRSTAALRCRAKRARAIRAKLATRDRGARRARCAALCPARARARARARRQSPPRGRPAARHRSRPDAHARARVGQPHSPWGVVWGQLANGAPGVARSARGWPVAAGPWRPVFSGGVGPAPVAQFRAPSGRVVTGGSARRGRVGVCVGDAYPLEKKRTQQAVPRPVHRARCGHLGPERRGAAVRRGGRVRDPGAALAPRDIVGIPSTAGGATRAVARPGPRRAPWPPARSRAASVGVAPAASPRAPDGGPGPLAPRGHRMSSRTARAQWLLSWGKTRDVSALAARAPAVSPGWGRMLFQRSMLHQIPRRHGPASHLSRGALHRGAAER